MKHRLTPIEERLDRRLGSMQDQKSLAPRIRPASRLNERFPYYGNLSDNSYACIFCNPKYDVALNNSGMHHITAKRGKVPEITTYDSDRLSLLFGAKHISARENAQKVDPLENSAAYYEAYLQSVVNDAKLLAITVYRTYTGHFIKSLLFTTE